MPDFFLRSQALLFNDQKKYNSFDNCFQKTELININDTSTKVVDK